MVEVDVEGSAANRAHVAVLGTIASRGEAIAICASCNAMRTGSGHRDATVLVNAAPVFAALQRAAFDFGKVVRAASKRGRCCEEEREKMANLDHSRFCHEGGRR